MGSYHSIPSLSLNTVRNNRGYQIDFTINLGTPSNVDLGNGIPEYIDEVQSLSLYEYIFDLPSGAGNCGCENGGGDSGGGIDGGGGGGFGGGGGGGGGGNGGW
jgi:uncharacterized membrane protein YgcG